MDRPQTYPISIVNNLLHDFYCRVFEDIAEDAPWLPMVTAMQRPFVDRDHMISCYKDAIFSASKLDQMALVKTYGQIFRDQFTVNEAIDEDLKQQLQLQMDLYQQKFNFTYVLPVTQMSADDVLADMISRQQNEEFTEFRLALSHIFEACAQRLMVRIDG